MLHALKRSFGRDREERRSGPYPLAVPRVSVCTDLCRSLGWLPDSAYRDAPMASDAELTRFHDREYVEALRRAEETQSVSLEERECYRINADGNPIYDANGKFLKGPNYWKPEPKIRAVLAAMMKDSG